MSEQKRRFYEFGAFRLDTQNHRLAREDGETIALTPKEFEVLLVLLENAGNVVAKDKLLDAVWKDAFVAEETLTRNVSWLRKKLGGEKFIETVPKLGYRFAAEVSISDGVENATVVEEQTLTRITVEETVSIPDRILEDGLQTLEIEDANKKIAALPNVAASSRRRVVASLLFALGAVAIAAIGLFGYQSFSGKKSNAQMILRVAPFSGLPGREDFPAFSPDGRQMAFAWDGGGGVDNLDVYVKIIGAGEPVRLTKNEADDINPAFAPDGRFIAFVRSLPTTSEVILISALGGGERKLATLRSVRSSLSFAPDGKTLAVADNDSTRGETGIFLLDVETGAKRRVTSPPEFSSDSDPRFSPNGKSIAFVRAASPVAQELYIVSTSGGEARQLTADKTQFSGIAWGADGEQIVFASLRASNRLNLWEIAAGGGEPVLIATGGKNPSHPAVAPDGKRVAYVEATTDANIWQIEFDETEKQFARGKFIASSQADHSPNISPDGGRVVFASDRTGNYEIWVADAAGANARQLTDLKTSAAGTPRFSPDGKFVVFDAQTNGKGDIFIIGAEGGSPRDLTANAAHDVLPAWSADGRFVFFCSDRSGERQIWKASADGKGGGEAIQITRQGGFESFASPDGREIFYTKNRGVAGIWRVSVDSGAEESAIAELSEAGHWRYWTVTPDGIYFVARNSNPPFAIKFYSFAKGEISDVREIEKTPLWIYPGLAAAPDGKTILYAQSDQNTGSIMLGESREQGD